MSETQDLLIYNFYDYMKTIFIYSHVKTYLIDPARQDFEWGFDFFLLGISGSFLFIIGFKMFVIFFYFLFIQALIPCISFIIKSKCKIFNGSTFMNCCNYCYKITKRFFTFNFYLFENNIIGIVMIISYLLFVLSSFSFFILNNKQIESPEKTLKYMYFFYIHFLSFVWIQLLCSSFYACRNMKIATLSAFGIFLLLIAITIIGYVITNTIENVDGIFEYDDPQKCMNIIYNSVFLLLNGNALFNIITYKKRGKYNSIIKIYRGELFITFQRKRKFL